MLVRVNAQSEAYEQALSRAKVPYVLRGGERFFERPEVREAMVLLRGAARAADDGAAAGDLVAIGAAPCWPAPAGGPTSRRPGIGAQRERWENVAALVRLAQEAQSAARSGRRRAADVWPASPPSSPSGPRLSTCPTVEGVTLASLHAAKGLEWDAVFLVGLVEGVLPISYAVTPEALAEERRLLYVGVTRARRHLTLSWAKAREAGRRPRKPSRFLAGIAPETEARPAAVALQAPWTQRSARAGRSPSSGRRCASGARERAAEQKQPAFCVFTDATLEAIASKRPATLAAVAGTSRA